MRILGWGSSPYRSNRPLHHRLIAERGEFLRQATAFKGIPVPTPERYAHTLSKMRSWALDAKADPAVVEATWRAMIDSFIAAQG